MRFVKAHFFWRAIFVIACMGALSNFSSADVIKLYEVTNNKQTPAGDARLTFNVNPTSGASDVFGPGTVNGNMITFMGGHLPQAHRPKLQLPFPKMQLLRNMNLVTRERESLPRYCHWLAFRPARCLAVALLWALFRSRTSIRMRCLLATSWQP